MSTKFALALLEMKASDGSLFTFFFDGNGKITRENSSFENPVANAFSLVQVEDCPFATPLCTSVCYVHRLEKAEEEIHAAYRRNSVTIRKVLGKEDWFWDSVCVFSDWIQTHCRSGFRWHVSGDIISEKHAFFIGKVCECTPSVPFWIYTRSFAFLRPLVYLKNLVVNLSADRDNYTQALAIHRALGLRICYLTVDGEVPNDLPNDSVIFPPHELRGRDLPNAREALWWKSLTQRQKKIVCPPDFFGQSEKLRCGPYRKCLI